MRKVIVGSMFGLVLFGSGFFIGGGLHHDRCWFSRVPYGPSVEWACLSPDVAASLIAAEKTAIAVGRDALDEWHNKITSKVDKDFLDQHLSFVNTWRSTANNWWTKIVHGADAALIAKLEDQNRLFQATVLTDEQLNVDMEAVARAMTDAFADALDSRLEKIALRYRMTSAQLDAFLLGKPSPPLIDVVEHNPVNIGLRVDRRFKIINEACKKARPLISSTLKGLNTFTGAQLMQEAGREMAKKGVEHGAHSAAHHAVKHVAHHATKLTVAKASGVVVAKAGTVLLGGPFAVVAVSGALTWEWWDHQKQVAVQKPTLLKQIEDAFRVYESALLRPDGHLGSGIRNMRDDIESALANR